MEMTFWLERAEMALVQGREMGSDMPKIMKIAAIREAFADEWVAAEVLRVDKADVPLAGQVITHSPDKQEVYQAVKATWRGIHSQDVYFLYGEPIPEGVGVALPSASRIRGRLAYGGVLLVPVRVQGQDFEFWSIPGQQRGGALLHCSLDGMLGMNALKQFRMAIEADTEILVLARLAGTVGCIDREKRSTNHGILCGGRHYFWPSAEVRLSNCPMRLSLRYQVRT